ncbi:MAG: BamA/TamA family outer membrane protein, partial [Azoarcus sp.]|nr:BamA/TamA family outer membrane protein [Azoarcus sp.]
QYRDFCRDFGCSGPNGVGDVEVDSVVLSIGWGRDTRNSYLYPTKGLYQRIHGEVATAPGDLRYGKATYQFQYWIPMGRDHALMFNTEFGFAKGYNQKPVPFYKNFYMGGINSVRGYESYSIGPKDSDGNSLGGTRKFLGNLEFFFPPPGAGTDRSFRISTFVDAGYVWGEDRNTRNNQKIRASDLRYSAGVALTWNSPVGPLKFSLGYPLNKKEGDKTRPFDFLLGATF